MKLTKFFTGIYAIGVIITVSWFGFLVSQNNWLQTDLHTLLPQNQEWTTLQILADTRQEQHFNQQIIALVGDQDPNTAFKLARQIAQSWRESKLFTQVTAGVQPDLTKLRQEISQIAFATLPSKIRTQLLQDPASYFQQYAQDLVNPFNHNNLLSLDQDWLGFGRFALRSSTNKITWNIENGMLYIKEPNFTWVLLQGELSQNSFIDPSVKLKNLITANRQTLEQAGGEFKITGSAIFAINAKQQAESESQIMSVLSIGLTLILLLSVFRSFRILGIFSTIFIGMLNGIVAVVLVFGKIHVLTLVIGTSLVGLLIDFPLHWLVNSLFTNNWNGLMAMRKLRFTFVLSLLVTLLGYVLLGFTSLPILQQTALFSAVALISTLLTTYLFLPAMFKNFQPQANLIHRPAFKAVQNLLISWKNYSLNVVVLAGLLVLSVLGLAKLNWQNDLRQWVALNSSLLQEAQTIAKLSGIDLGNQYFLITSPTPELLLEKDAKFSAKLAQQNLKFKSLSQWLMSECQQKELAWQLQQLPPQSYEILQKIGISQEQIQQSLNALTKASQVSISQALNTQLGKAWQMLYLGELLPYQFASVIKIWSNPASSSLQNLANNQDIFWQDKLANLNHAFKEAQSQAVLLKIVSFLIAGLGLWKLFEFKSALRILLIPSTAIVATMAIFGLLGLTINLFVIFGLLLVSAIGIDYAVFMKTLPEDFSQKSFTLTLTAITTLISFALLGLSSTPAVASFGLSVSIGVIISLLVTLKTMS